MIDIIEIKRLSISVWNNWACGLKPGIYDLDIVYINVETYDKYFDFNFSLLGVGIRFSWSRDKE
jgi:hypothetical protein